MVGGLTFSPYTNYRLTLKLMIMKQKLTEAQRQAICAFLQALKNLAEAGVVIVRNNDDDSLMFFNGNDIQEFVSYDEKDFYPEAVDITDYADDIQIDSIVDHAYYPDYGHERVYAILRNSGEG